MRIKTLLLIALFVGFLSGCGGNRPKVELRSTEYVFSINTSGGVQYTFENQDILQIKLDFVFDPAIADGLDPSSEDYRSEIYRILVEGAHLYFDNQEMSLQYGYWPEKAGRSTASEMTLFYLLPEGHNPDLIQFVYDGEVLGDEGEGLAMMLNPD